MKGITEIDGRDVKPTAGRLVRPDGWSWGMPLADCEWDGARFRIPSARYEGVTLAANVTVTGRTIRNGMVRVSIEWVGDGEPGTVSGGYMNIG